MATPLRKSTAGQVRKFLMVDSTTGLAKSGLSIANTDIKLIFEGGTTQTSKNSGGATEIGSTGTYYMTLDATDSATLGNVHVDIQKTGALPYFTELEVVPALVWDALYAASGGAIMVDLQTVKTQAVTCATSVTVLASVGTAATSTAQTADNNTRLADIQTRLPAALTSNGNMKSSLVEILTTALTETSGLIAAGFKKFFNVATPTGTVNSIPDAVAGAAGGIFIAGSNAATSAALTLGSINVTGPTTFAGDINYQGAQNYLGNIYINHADGSLTTYTPGANTNVARGTALKTAIAASTYGDIIRLDPGPNVYDLGSATGYIGAIPGIQFKGNGKNDTIILSQHSAVLGSRHPIINPGSYSEWSGFTLYHNVNAAGCPFGSLNGGAGTTAFTNVYLHDARIIGSQDCIFDNFHSDTSMIVENVDLYGNWDTIAIGAATFTKTYTFKNVYALADFGNLRFYPTIAPSGGLGATARAINLIAGICNVTIEGGKYIAGGSSNDNAAIENQGAATVSMTLSAGTIVQSSGTNALDFNNASGNTTGATLDPSVVYSTDKLSSFDITVNPFPQTGDSYARIGAAGAGLTALGDTRLAHLNADMSSRMATFSLPTNFSSMSISGGGAVTVGTNSDKTGYALSSTGLDSIAVTAPTGVASTFPAMVVQLFRRFFSKSTLTSTQLKTYGDNGTTVVTTQTVSDDGNTQVQGKAS